jgi:hypothetical protein
MSEEDREARWQEIMEAQADFVDEPPSQVERIGQSDRRRRSALKARHFDEALSGLGSWSIVEAPRRRLSA